MKYSDISITPLKDNRYRVNKEIMYKNVIVPEGYCTNGANIPRAFWSLFPPNKSDFMPAVIVHDYLCDQERYVKADWYFDDILKDLEVHKVSRWVLVNAVKVYHKIKYKEYYER